MEQKRVLIYCRVSTSDRQNPLVQASALREFCAARGWTVTEEITDHGYSGGTDKRPGIAKLMKLARARKIDVVAVTKLDRLFRSLKHLIGTLDEFESLGVQFVSVGDQIDQTTAAGKLMLAIVGGFAEFERALIRERTLAGIAFARSSGKVLGRPQVRDDSKIRSLRAKGLSLREIGRRVGVSKSTVSAALSGNTLP